MLRCVNLLKVELRSKKYIIHWDLRDLTDFFRLTNRNGLRVRLHFDICSPMYAKGISHFLLCDPRQKTGLFYRILHLAHPLSETQYTLPKVDCQELFVDF